MGLLFEFAHTKGAMTRPERYLQTILNYLIIKDLINNRTVVRQDAFHWGSTVFPEMYTHAKVFSKIAHPHQYH